MYGVLKVTVILLLILVDFSKGIPVKNSFHTQTTNDTLVPLTTVTNAALPLQIHHISPESHHNVKGKVRDFLNYDINGNVPYHRQDQGEEPGHLANFYNPNTGLNFMKVQPIHHQDSADFRDSKFQYHYTPDSENAYERHTSHPGEAYSDNGDEIDQENTLSKYITPAVYEKMGKNRINHRDSSLLGLPDTKTDSTEDANTDRFLSSLKSLMAPLPEQMKNIDEPDYDDIMKELHSNNNNLDKTDKFFFGNKNTLAKDLAKDELRHFVDNRGGNTVKDMNQGDKETGETRESHYHGQPEESRGYNHVSHDYHDDISHHAPYHHDEPEYHHDEPEYHHDEPEYHHAEPEYHHYETEYHPGDHPGESHNYDSESHEVAEKSHDVAGKSHDVAEKPHEYEPTSHETNMFPDKDRGMDFKHDKFDSSYPVNNMEHSNTDSDSRHFNDGHNSDYTSYTQSEFGAIEKDNSYNKHDQEGPEHAGSDMKVNSYFKHEQESAEDKDWGAGEKGSLGERGMESKTSFEDNSYNKHDQEGPEHAGSDMKGPTSERGLFNSEDKASLSPEDRSSSYEDRGPVDERKTEERDGPDNRGSETSFASDDINDNEWGDKDTRPTEMPQATSDTLRSVTSSPSDEGPSKRFLDSRNYSSADQQHIPTNATL